MLLEDTRPCERHGLTERLSREHLLVEGLGERLGGGGVDAQPAATTAWAPILMNSTARFATEGAIPTRRQASGGGAIICFKHTSGVGKAGNRLRTSWMADAT